MPQCLASVINVKSYCAGGPARRGQQQRAKGAWLQGAGSVDWLTTSSHTCGLLRLGPSHRSRCHHPSSLLLMPHTLDQVSGTCPATLPHAVCPPFPRAQWHQHHRPLPSPSPSSPPITHQHHHYHCHPSHRPRHPSCLQLVPGVGCRLMVLPWQMSRI